MSTLPRAAMVAALVLASGGGACAAGGSPAAGGTGEPAGGPISVRALSGAPVTDSNGQSIGKVADVLVDPDGSINSIVIAAGGFLGAGNRNIIVARDRLTLTQRGNTPAVVLDAPKDELQSAPGFHFSTAARSWLPDRKARAEVAEARAAGFHHHHHHHYARAARPGAQTQALHTVRALIEPGDMPPRDVAGYGLVAFTTLPVADDQARAELICDAYKATLIAQADLPEDTPLSEQMITFWPVKSKSEAEASGDDCAHLVSNYALQVGLDAINDADKQNERLASRRGPFLVAWVPAESRAKPDAVVLVMDLSPFDGARTFVQVFQDWRQKITDNPDLWQRGRGFDLERVRQVIHDTFDRYGDGLMRLIKG